MMALVAEPSGKLVRLVKLIPFRVPAGEVFRNAAATIKSVAEEPFEVERVKLLPVIRPEVVPTDPPVPACPPTRTRLGVAFMQV
jgi:hypothetical protein